MEFETKEAAEYALFAMNNRNVFDKVSMDKISPLLFFNNFLTVHFLLIPLFPVCFLFIQPAFFLLLGGFFVKDNPPIYIYLYDLNHCHSIYEKLIFARWVD